MAERIAPIIGTLVLVLFGALFAFVLPRIIDRQGGRDDQGEIPVAKWIRILGLIVMGIGLIQVVLTYVF